MRNRFCSENRIFLMSKYNTSISGVPIRNCFNWDEVENKKATELFITIKNIYNCIHTFLIISENF